MPSRAELLGVTPVKRPTQRSDAEIQARARLEKMKAQADADWKRKMKPLPTSVIGRPGSKPIKGVDYKPEQKYSFGAKGEELTASQYRERTGKEPPTGYKDKKMREVWAAVDATGLGRTKTLAKGVAKGLGWLASATDKKEDQPIPIPTRSGSKATRTAMTDILTRPTVAGRGTAPTKKAS